MVTREEEEELRMASQRAAIAAGALLDAEIQVVMARAARLAEFKPRTADEEVYRQLLQVINEARSKNEATATVKRNIVQLGNSAVLLFKEMAAIAQVVA